MKILGGNSGWIVRESERFPGFERSGIPQRAGFQRVSAGFSVVILVVLAMVLASALAAGRPEEVVSEGPRGDLLGGLGSDERGRVIMYSSQTNSCEALFNFHPRGLIQGGYIEAPRRFRDSRNFQKKITEKFQESPGTAIG